MQQKPDDKSQSTLATTEALDWLIPLGVKFTNQNCFIPIYEKGIREIEKNIIDNVNHRSKEDFKHLCYDISSYFNDISIVLQFVTPSNSNMPSFLKLLLNIPPLQDTIMKSIGQFFSLTILEDNIQKLRKIALGIVRDLTFLTIPINEKKLTDMLFDSISNCHQSIKEILLQYLFLLIDGSEIVINRLLKLMLENVMLTCDILSAIEGFSLSADSKEKVRQHVLSNILPAASTKDLPTVIKFLVATTDDSNASVTVNEFRENLIVVSPQSVEGSLTSSDTDFFVILQLKNALQFNHNFCKSFILALEFSNGEFGTLDIWVLFCLYSIFPMKQKAQQMISKMCGKSLTNQSIINAVSGHKKAIECICTAVIDLMNWMIGSNIDSVSKNGITLASVLFDEIDDIGSLQDIIGTLLIQLEIGDEPNKKKVISALELISIDHSQKLKTFSQLIQGFLWSSDTTNPQLYSVMASITARLTFEKVEDIDNQEGTQISIGFTKMMSSIHPSFKELGVIGSAAVINRIDEISSDDIQYLSKKFSSIMVCINDDPRSVLTFYKHIYQNKNRSNEFNTFLIQQLESQIFDILYDDEGVKSIDKKYIQYDLGELSTRSINLALCLPAEPGKESKSSRKIYEKWKMEILVFSSYGLSLLLDAHRSLGHNLREQCADIFGASFVVASDERSSQEYATVLLYAQSYIAHLLNFFLDNEAVDEYCILRMEQLIEIEKHLIDALRDIDIFEHPFYGVLFPKHHSFLRKMREEENVYELFIEKYRSSFPSPSQKYFSILYALPLPLSDNHLKIVLRLVIDYTYCLTEKNGTFYEVEFYESLDFVSHICNKILPLLLKDERKASVLICERIFKFLKIEFAQPQYKDKTRFTKLIESCCKNEDRNFCFKKFAKIMAKNSENLSISSKLALIVLLRSILHSGPNQKVDLCGHESKVLYKLAKQLLTSQSPALSKNGVQAVLPIFLDHSKKILNDIVLFVTAVFPLDILSGNRCDDWPSLNPDTFPIFFNQCFLVINAKLVEIKKRVLSNNYTISEEFINAVMNRLNKLASLAKGLLLQTCGEKIPASLLRVSIKQGISWVDTIVSLFPFFCDSREFNSEAIDEFLDVCADIVRQLQTVVDHVRRSEKSLQNMLPSISKSLASWSYSLKSCLSAVQEDTKLEPAKERTLSGEIINTQQYEPSES